MSLFLDFVKVVVSYNCLSELKYMSLYFLVKYKDIYVRSQGS